MENVKKIVKKYSINKLELGLGKSDLEKAGIKTVGEVFDLIDSQNLESIKGIGKKKADEIERFTKSKIMEWEKEIKYFCTLPPYEEQWDRYLKLARSIFGVREGEEFDEGSLDCEGIIVALSTLTFMEERLIKLRYGLSDGRYWTLDQLAKEFSISREKARLTEVKALRKLRHPWRTRKMKKK